jgi:CubicO group peptidase (beta-lactamase class C family)
MALEQATPASLGFCPDRTQAIVSTLQGHVDRRHLPGAVAMVVRRGQVLLNASVGQQNPQDGTPMGLDAIFRIYSMTKPIVSAATMALVERGKLLLTDPVARYLPEFSKVQVMARVDGHAVTHAPKLAPTVHDLLRHTSGLSYENLDAGAPQTEPVQRLYAQARIGSRERSNAEFSLALAEIPLPFEPASVWEYSRSTDLLGALLEVVAGQSLGQLLHDTVLGPLGMEDTGFVVPPEKHGRIAEPFAQDPDGGTAMPLMDVRRKARMEAGGAGLASTAQDYARFLQCLLNLGTLDGVRILAPQTVHHMTADHLGSIAVNRIGRSSSLLPPGHGFGLGFAVRTHEGMSALPGSKGLYYWGGISGTTFFVDPAREFFALMMLQAPNQRDFYRPLFRNLVYAALID